MKRNMNPKSLENLRSFETGFDSRRNLGGRPRRGLTDAMIELLNEPWPEDPTITWAQAIARAMIRAAAEGDVRAAEEIANRVEGKPQQALAVHLSGQRIEAFAGMSDTQIQSEMAELRRRDREEMSIAELDPEIEALTECRRRREKQLQ